jgi:AcrR family transcriptional regulator
VDRIASEAKVSVGLLYRFFDSKSAIIEAIILQENEVQLEQATAAIEAASAEVVETSLAVATRMGAEGVDRDRVALMLEIAAEVSRNPSLRSFVRAKQVHLRKTLADKLVRKGMGKKSAQQVISRLEVMSAIASGAAIHAMLYSDAPFERSLEQIMRLVRDAARAET